MLLDVGYQIWQYYIHLYLQHETECVGEEEGGDRVGAGEEGEGEEDDIVLQEYHSEDENKPEPELV